MRMGGGRGWQGGGWGQMEYETPAQLPIEARKHLIRVAHYLRPYSATWCLILVCIGVGALLGLIPPLLIRALIDQALPERNGTQLNMLAIGMVVAPLIAGLLGVGQN